MRIGATHWLIGVIVFVFVLQLVGGDSLTVLLAQTTELVLGHGAYWQLFTSMFVHFGVFHLISNLYGLFYFGLLNETLYGRNKFLTIYFLSGLGGNISSLFLLSVSAISGGASGAIFGLIGSYVAYERKARHLGSALFYAIMLFIASSGVGVNIFAHFFGLVAGLVVGLMLTRRPDTGGSY